MNQLVGETLRRGGVRIGWLGDAPAASPAATPPALPAAGPTTPTAPAASPPAQGAAPAATSPATPPAPLKDKGLLAQFSDLPTLAKVGIGVGAAAVVVGTVAAIAAAVK
jgi:hypothetical protein